MGSHNHIGTMKSVAKDNQTKEKQSDRLSREKLFHTFFVCFEVGSVSVFFLNIKHNFSSIEKHLRILILPKLF